ncbi:hypothetical protein N0V91_006968 [Didymella pomorum]|uniref:Uncharacterized protein n=1 Tax=Didymella pomorum TaxID=749634 RepID=A0A9W8ZE31_9PLEO|nr:hypothetical protein N0V91_006968 [Didymella pomorum]
MAKKDGPPVLPSPLEGTSWAKALLSTVLTFLGVSVGVVAAKIVIILFSKKWYLPHVRKAVRNNEPKPPFATSRLEPEKRLPLAVVRGPWIIIGLLM